MIMIENLMIILLVILMMVLLEMRMMRGIREEQTNNAGNTAATKAKEIILSNAKLCINTVDSTVLLVRIELLYNTENLSKSRAPTVNEELN